MRLNLYFAAGRITGGGSDAIGPFEIAGSYDGSVAVIMNKTYPTHTLYYDGKWDGSMIFGRWQPVWTPRSGGPFEIWPESEASQIEVSEQELATATRIAGQALPLQIPPFSA